MEVNEHRVLQAASAGLSFEDCAAAGGCTSEDMLNYLVENPTFKLQYNQALSAGKIKATQELLKKQPGRLVSELDKNKQDMDEALDKVNKAAVPRMTIEEAVRILLST